MKIELVVLKAFEDVLGFFSCHRSGLIVNKVALGY